ncbi:Phospholipase B-like [Carpediemonas membranifera]|uniref:Phospholipase B-like n=1 Tax=Carpediemonas membranifera TaxID=201153 RepID=A0A8J6AVK5_9EUKA|nr:Phospholipase B-like [Carpediemonas membranifera]|eukprot:KAG9393605.1 Phospholipase B-like [Carpediemonas membranifera]
MTKGAPRMLLFLLLALFAVVGAEVVPGSVIMQSGSLVFQNKEDAKAIASGNFEDVMNSTGWSYLHVTTNGDYKDGYQAIAAGYLEGYLTADLLEAQWHNYHDHFVADFTDKQVPDAVITFFTDHYSYMVQQTQMKSYSDDYWYQVMLRLKELQGMTDGYNAAGKKTQLSVIDMLMMTSEGDCYEIVPAVMQATEKDTRLSIPDFQAFDIEAERHFHFRTHCSALIKLSGNEVAAGHTTWTQMSEMVRVYKSFEYNFSTGKAKYSFSSKPGMLFSKDDYYTVETPAGHKMVVMETTNSIMNTTLYQFVKPQTLLTWMRVPLAIRMAATPQQWFEVFEKENSGTYCNQWMVLDTTTINADGTMQPGSFFVGEQIPGYVHYADMTAVLNEQGYWPSYNIPYFKDIYTVSGYPNAVAKKGDGYSYTKCPRARLFAEHQATVTGAQGVFDLLRYNDPTDPVQNGSPAAAIASRYDLLPPTDPLHAAFGAIDAKTTDSSLLRTKSLETASLIQSGPTHNNGRPAFSWSGYVGQTYTHLGMPDAWNMPQVQSK